MNLVNPIITSTPIHYNLKSFNLQKKLLIDYLMIFPKIIKFIGFPVADDHKNLNTFVGKSKSFTSVLH